MDHCHFGYVHHKIDKNKNTTLVVKIHQFDQHKEMLITQVESQHEGWGGGNLGF